MELGIDEYLGKNRCDVAREVGDDDARGSEVDRLRIGLVNVVAFIIHCEARLRLIPGFGDACLGKQSCSCSSTSVGDWMNETYSLPHIHPLGIVVTFVQ